MGEAAVIQFQCVVHQRILRAVDNYTVLQIVSDHEDISSRLIARYILGLGKKMLAYPSGEARAVIVSNYEPKVAQDIQKHLGLTVQACSSVDSAALGFSIQQLVLFLLYDYLLSLGSYRVFSSGCSAEEGLSLMQYHQNSTSLHSVQCIRLLACVINHTGEGYVRIHHERYKKVNMASQLAASNDMDDLFEDDDLVSALPAPIEESASSSKPRPGMLLHTGEDMTLIEEYAFIPTSKSSSALFTTWDEHSWAAGLREYVPKSAAAYALYWQLAAGIKLDVHSCWSLARVADKVEERVVPREGICRTCIDGAQPTASDSKHITDHLLESLQQCSYLTSIRQAREEAHAPRLVKASSIKRKTTHQL